MRAVSLAQLARTRTRPYENTTLPKPPSTLSIRSLVLVHLHRLPLTIGGKVVDINPPSLSHELPCQRSRCNWLTCDSPHHPSKGGTRKLCCRTVIYMHIDIHVHRTITRNQREDVFPLLFLAPTLSLSLFFPSGPDRKSAYRSSSDLSVSSLGGKLSHLGCTTSANKDQDAGSKEQ